MDNATPAHAFEPSPKDKAWDRLYQLHGPDLRYEAGVLLERATAFASIVEHLASDNGDKVSSKDDEGLDLVVADRVLDAVVFWLRSFTEEVARSRETIAEIRSYNAERDEVTA